MFSEHHPLARQAVDIRRTVAHRAEAIGADILPADIIGKYDEDIGFVSGLSRDCEETAENVV